MSDLRAAYDASGAAWASRPAGVYRRLAVALLDEAGPLGGGRVLDVGAGTAVAATEALAHGASQVLATDLAPGMLACRDAGVPAAVADAVRLPFPDDTFDLVVLNFVLGHLPDPVAALVEGRRVGSVLAASAFDASWAHPAKAAVDATMAGFGFVLPPWYAAMKAGEDEVASPAGLTRLSQAAGCAESRVTRIDVPAGLDGPADVVAWRWGMAHLAPYLSTLDQRTRERAWESCVAAVDGLPPVVVPMLALIAS